MKTSNFHKINRKKIDYNPKLQCFLDLIRCLGAALNPLAGLMRPAGHMFEVPALDFECMHFGGREGVLDHIFEIALKFVK
jgi:hypothetical protein